MISPAFSSFLVIFLSRTLLAVGGRVRGVSVFIDMTLSIVF